MRNDLVKVVTQYLQIETNYAVIIHGNYGIGKTYFYKKELSPEIKKISTPKDEQKKYIPIHISLFGLNTLEEIQTQIFFNIYPILKNKELKLAAGFVKSIIRGIASINLHGELDKYIADINLSASEWINYDELVLCFDDIDRKSDTLNTKDFLGFINTLVENHGAKIILIANEDTLRNDKDFIKIKEKIIGVSIEFEANSEKSFDSIIDERYSSSGKIYYNFLNEYRKHIINITAKNLGNLRNLIFFLEHFSVVFYNLKNLFETNKELSVSEGEKLRIVLEFSIAIAFEFKAGHLNPSNYDDFQQNKLLLPNLDAFLRNQTDKKIEVKKSYIEEFKEKYFFKSNYFFFDSIFLYLLGKEAFDIDKLKMEIDSIFNKEGEVSEEQKVLNQLGYYNCLKLTDREYRKQTNKMLSYVDEGRFRLEQYPTVFHFALRFDNVLKFNIKRLKIRFKKGILTGLENYKNEEYPHLRLVIDEKSEFKDDLKEIMNYCFEINNRIIKQKEADNLKSLFDKFETNINDFIQTAQDSKFQFRFSPFWMDISIHKVYRIINQLSNNDIIEYGFYLQNRYRPNIYEKLYPEQEFLLKLKDKINGPKKRLQKNLRNASLNFLVKHIEESLNNFN